MPKLFIMSDIHGYYDKMIETLNEVGFDPDNHGHWFVGLGDYIDRGNKPMEVIKYLHNLPQKILLRGNHEDLFEKCCKRGEAYEYDYSNGTAKTIFDIASKSQKLDQYDDIGEMGVYALRRIRPFLDNLIDFFETEKYIFVHSWIPVHGDMYNYEPYRNYVYDPDWRESSPEKWKEARWPNPFELGNRGLCPDKTVIFGHWHTSWVRNNSRKCSEFGSDADFSIYFSDEEFEDYSKNKYIGIDACTAFSNKMSCLVLEDNFI